MRPAPTTTTAMLSSLRDPSQDAVWCAFDARFRPLLTAFAIRLGLRPGDAEEIAQETLVVFVQEFRQGRYDRTRGRLSSWVISIAQHRIAHRRLAIGRAASLCDESALEDMSDHARLTAVWEDEERRLILTQAMDVLREGRTAAPTLRAFELFAIRGVPAEETARACGMTVGDVYTAKNRVTRRLREIVAELTTAWRTDE